MNLKVGIYIYIYIYIIYIYITIFVVWHMEYLIYYHYSNIHSWSSNIGKVPSIRQIGMLKTLYLIEL